MRASSIIKTQKNILGEIEKDIPELKDAFTKIIESSGRKVDKSQLDKTVTPAWIVQEANHNVYLGNYVRSVTEKVAPRFTLKSERGNIKFLQKDNGPYRSNLQSTIAFK